MQCSIVIPHRNRHQLLARTLAGLAGQNSHREFEVIVVDDGSDISPSRAIDMTSFGGLVRVLDQPSRGIAGARNAGWKNARGDVVVFLDCDQLTAPDFVDRHCAAFETYEDEILQIGLRENLSPDDTVSSAPLPAARHDTDERTNFFRLFSYNLAAIEVGWHVCYGHNISVRRATLQRLGGFDEKFRNWGLEDCEFAYRLKSGGVKLMLNPAVTVHHQHHENEFNDNRFSQWLRNLQYFETVHPHFQVKAQYLLCGFFDPREREKTGLRWVEFMRRMETAVRVASGRSTTPREPFTLHDPTLADLEAAVTGRPGFAIAANLPVEANERIAEIQLNQLFRDVQLQFY